MLESQLCPDCRSPLEPVTGRHGLVYVCGDCRGGVTTLAVLKKVAPREFVSHVWQAAWKHGTASERACPSCARPLLEMRAPEVVLEPRVDVCLRCYLVWLGAEAMAGTPVHEALPALAGPTARAIAEAQGNQPGVIRELQAVADSVLASLARFELHD